ncbi:MAG: hypothetical protein EPN14_00510 [Gallionella sp.]|nr:MAG: hypothetical protein EPN14_00510 [Gallionella sp.]
METFDVPSTARAGELEIIRQHCRLHGKKFRRQAEEPPPLPAGIVPAFLLTTTTEHLHATQQQAI